MTTQSIEQLREFINKAEKLGKYPRNTAVAMFSALKVVEEGLVDEEPADPHYLVEHLEEIFNRQLKRLNLTAGSLQAYMTRVRRAIKDFQKYGQDPKALHAWKPKIMQRATKVRNGSPQSEESAPGASGFFGSQIVTGQKNTGLRTLVWSLRPDLLIQIQLPTDLNEDDVARLKKLLDLEVELTSGQMNKK